MKRLAIISMCFLCSCVPGHGLMDKVEQMGNRCTEEEYAVLSGARKGDLEIVKEYINNGGSSIMRCYNPRVKWGRWERLSYAVTVSKSVQLVSFYLTQPNSPTIRNTMLGIYVSGRNDDLTKILLTHDAHITEHIDQCFVLGIVGNFEYLLSFGYDINWQNPESNGNSVLQLYSGCDFPKEEDELITILQFLIDHGARTDLKNDDGKTALDLTVNPKVKEFLTQYE